MGGFKAFSIFFISIPLFSTGFDELYLSALQYNAEYQTARYELLAQIEKGERASSAYMPNIALSGTKNYNTSDITYTKNTPSYQNGSRNYVNDSLTLKLNQPLFRLQSYYSLRESHYYKKTGEFALESARQTLIYELAKIYLDALLAEKIESLAKAKYDFTKIVSSEIEKRFKLHEATKADLHSIRAKLNVTKADLVTANYNYKAAKESLIQISQMDVNTIDEVKWKSYVVPSEEILWWKAKAKQENLDVKISRAVQEVNEIRVSNAWSAHAPTADIVGSYGKAYSSSDVNGIGSDSKFLSIGVQINIPIFEGGATQSKVRESLAEYNKALSETNKYVRLAQLDAVNAYLQLAASLERYNALKDASVSAYESIEATRIGLNAGRKTVRDLSDTQEQFYNTQKEMYTAQYDYILKYITLYRAAGILNKNNLDNLGVTP